MVDKWSGSLEMEVTHPNRLMELQLPSKMTDVIYGTWMMTEYAVIDNGTSFTGTNLYTHKVGHLFISTLKV
jgi:hypothetical protein